MGGTGFGHDLQALLGDRMNRMRGRLQSDGGLEDLEDAVVRQVIDELGHHQISKQAR